MQKTSNYQLNQWEATDVIKRGDFNADNAAIDQALASKAEQSALNNTNAAVEANTAAIAKKAEQTSLDATNAAVACKAERSALNEVNAQVTALTAALGSGGHTCRITMGSYTGTGTYGAKNPVTVQVDFYPVLAFMGSEEEATRDAWPSKFLRPCSISCSDSSTNSEMTVIWGENSISWYNISGSYGQNNNVNDVYYYVILGYDNTAA